MSTAADKILRGLSQQVANCRITADVRDKGQGFNQHTEGAVGLRGGSAAVNGSDHAFVAVIVFRNQESHDAGEKGAGGDSRLTAEGTEGFFVQRKLLCQPLLTGRFLKHIPNGKTVCIPTVQQRGVVCPGPGIGISFQCICFVQSKVKTGIGFGFHRVSVIGCANITG